jgi:hypothetical protein
MKRLTISGLMAVGVLALSVSVLAQDKPAPKEHTMTGCLRKGTAPDTYVVESTAEKGPKTIGIVSSTANLAPHVGHKIDITGTAVDAKTAESAKTAPPKAPHYMNLTAVKMVSATCP